MEYIALSVLSFAIVFVVSDLIGYLVSMRLRLAKGLIGNKVPIRTIVSRWNLKLLWTDQQLSPKSLWPIFLSIIMTQLLILLKLETSTFDEIELKLAFLFLQTFEWAMVIVWALKTYGSKHPFLKYAIVASLASLLLIATLMFQHPVQNDETLINMLRALRWCAGVFMWMLFVPALSIPRDFLSVPYICKRASEILAAGLLAWALPTVGTEIATQCLFFAAKMLLLLLMRDLLLVLLNTTKKTHLADYMVRQILPALVFYLGLVISGI